MRISYFFVPLLGFMKNSNFQMVKFYVFAKNGTNWNTVMALKYAKLLFTITSSSILLRA